MPRFTRTVPSCAQARRRAFIRTALASGAGLLAPLHVMAASSYPARGSSRAAEDQPEDIDPPEDLMREHGVLKRVLLIYEEAGRRIAGSRDLPPASVRNAADIIRTFIEGYHEKLEEDFLFPRFEKAGRLVDLTTVLRAQHVAGRKLTAEIIQLATPATLKDRPSASRLNAAMQQFVRMYNPHEAREDTVLFPALRGVVSKQEFAALGEDFEKREHNLFGEDGFEKMVDRVASIEKELGIYDLAQFTPSR